MTPERTPVRMVLESGLRASLHPSSLSGGLTPTRWGYTVVMIGRAASVEQIAGHRVDLPQDDYCSGSSRSAPTEKSDDMREADITNGEAVDPMVAVAERGIRSDPTPTPVPSDRASLRDAPTDEDEWAGSGPGEGLDDDFSRCGERQRSAHRWGSRPRTVGRWALAGLLFVAGTSHLTWNAHAFLAQVPRWVPLRGNAVVFVSGLAEIGLAGALVGLPSRRRQMGWIVAAFFVVIFPGNVSQFVTHTDSFGLNSSVTRGIRLAFQPLLVVWALWCTGVIDPSGSHSHADA